ncbi:dihydrofolate reductase family protein [Actinomyces minihominis]|uniref:dihydrofolate reductase family protein n=1 Tax=Actinomyces minihominis TaxID=2002838 RepID=UPI000C0775D8|nr:dihydrofolate reductase family protein [Actinomyces minihominis]
MTDVDPFESRPFVVSHVVTTLNGQGRGEFETLPLAITAAALSEEIRTAFQAPATLIDARQLEEPIGPFLLPPPEPSADGREATPHDGGYLVVLNLGEDPLPFDPLNPHAGATLYRRLEVLSSTCPPAHVDQLEKQGIPHFQIEGEAPDLDLTRFLEVLRTNYGIDALVSIAGPEINSLLLRSGLTDELSLVVLPVVEAGAQTQNVFAATSNPLGPTTFTLVSAQALEDGILWTRYR